MSKNTKILILLVIVFAFCLSGNGVYAFGAGNIPSFAYMEGKAFRHGDIEDALSQLVKRGAGGGFALSSLISKGSKFGGLDIKRVYFGNWLRDYSQAVDIAGLKKLQLQTIINLCMALGFLAHGYATNEFEVTEERLGVYLPTEHIDNPKGYGEGEDARKYNPKLRGPVDPRELEVDPRTGMKNYIANENGTWDTSKALVRRTLERCIHMGRQHRAQGRKQDEYEAYRLLGQALHTLEDFSAHSNFCELALVTMGHQDIFTHVGDNVRIQASNGKWVAPLVTGTFGSSDFIHSLLGEATDHISEASVSDLNRELEKAQVRSRSVGNASSPSDVLRDLFFKLPGGGGGEMSREMDGIERIRAGPSQGGKRPEDMSPQELHAVLWQVLSFRDSVVKKIEKTIEKIPGLGPLIEKLMDSISVFVFTTLEPFLKPIMKTATAGLQTTSAEVINNHDQYEVFNDPRASDPTHSFLSKDHFNLILNEPAGNVARIVLTYTVTLVAKAWDDASVNVHQLTEDVLQCLFHPDFHNSGSKIQREMMQYMQTWVQGLGHKQNDVLRRLTKTAVRNHENIRLGGEGGQAAAQGTFAYNEGVQVQHNIQGYVNQIPGVSQAQSFLGNFNGGPPGSRKDVPSSGGDTGYPGANSGHGHQSYNPNTGPMSQPPPPVPSGGHAADFFLSNNQNSGGSYSSPPNPSAPSFPGGPQNSSYSRPQGQPPSIPPASFSSAPPTSYAPPPGVPPSFSSMPGAPPPHHHHHHHHPPGHDTPGYNPSYESPSSFPSGGGMPSAPSSFPAYDNNPGYAPPPGPPPGFQSSGPQFPDPGGYQSSAPQFPNPPGQGGYPPPPGAPPYQYGSGRW